jgi:carbamoyltransferase
MGYILGVSGYYHDSAACLIGSGEILAAAQEERFSRKKHDARFPIHSIKFCLSEARIELKDVDAIVFYEKPLIKFERLLETYLGFAPRGFGSFLKAMPVWLKEKLFLKDTLTKEFKKNFGENLPEILFSEHHLSHAASAFFPSPFESAAVLCLDGVGEWSTTTAWHGEANHLTPLWEINFPHSLGLLYSAFTYFTGFKVNSGEYKLMGLAPYGKPVYVKQIMEELIDLKEDGSFRLNQKYFEYCTGLKMTSSHFDKLFGGPPRKAESQVTQREMDIARSIQEVTEEIVLRIARTLRKETGLKNLCLAGGVALNCVANGRLLREKIFDNIWIQPAAGDAGGALGSALVGYYHHFKASRRLDELDSMKGSYLGPEFSTAHIRAYLEKANIPHHYFEDSAIAKEVASHLAEEKVVGWFQGKMEFGPRALGNRSIIGDARSTKMQSVMNLKIKFRESFRPFAPSILREKVGDYFEMDTDSPYMLLVAPVKNEKRVAPKESEKDLWGIDLLKTTRSQIPAVTHVDYSARVQTVRREVNERYYDLIKEFEKSSGCPVIVNTSFNVRGEPIVCTPEDAYRCFMRTHMDTLVLGNFVLKKTEQPVVEGSDDWQKEFELD